MSKLTRRDFIKASAASFGTLVVSSTLTGCGGPNTNPRVYSDTVDQSPTGKFNHGVASGDPTQNAVILWTRITPDDAGLTQAQVAWEVALDMEFSNIVTTGTTVATPVSDFTVKIDLQGLNAGTVYYYRFASLGVESAIGRTKTLPAVDVSKVSLAIVSCSNFPAGHFNVYNELGKRDDLDAIVHLGDYIYEYGNGGYGTENSAAIGRALPDDNNTEILDLSDYRKRYGLYRTDVGLQSAHQQAAFIAVWDDHEIANDGWREGAENHSDDEGAFNDRKMAALQAYFEWMPIRPASVTDNETIFRQFNFGDLVSLYMLDTRYYGRDEGLTYGQFIDPETGALDAAGFQAAVGDPSRTMLGTEQLQWLQGSMQMSGAKWQVLGQQVLMGRMLLPTEILPYLANPSPAVFSLLQELAAIKERVLLNDPTLTATERARVETVAPYNLDAWDGYFVEREVILGTAAALGKNLVVLAGDTHNSWANNLIDMNGNAVGVEFATSSVSSPGLSEALGLDGITSGPFEDIVRLLIDNLKYFNVVERGFALVTFTPDDAQCHWHYVNNTDSTDYAMVNSRAHALRMKVGEPQLSWVNP